MKKQALWVRLLVLALALAMMVSVFAACTDEEDDGSVDDQTDTEGTDDGTQPVVFVEDDLENLNFGTTLTILVDGSYGAQVAPSEEVAAGNLVRAVIYKRNETVEARLGVEIEWIWSKGGGGANATIQEVEAACKTEPYDAICVYNLTPYKLAGKGLCANLYDEDNYLDLTAPWWPSDLLNEIMINDTLYAITESNDYGLLRNMMAMFFNADMLETRGMESPYDLVENNQWTIDKLAEMIKDTYSDENGNGLRDKDDIYGFVNATASKRDAWFYALGNRVSETRDGEPIYLIDSDNIQTYIEKMLDFYTDDTMLYDHEKYGGRGQNLMFLNEKAYFYSTGIFTTEQIKDREATFEYGVVPMPKMNSDQDRYYTHLSNTYDTWCVSFNAKDQDVISAVLECMASEAYRQIGPIYYDTYVKLRYASNEKLAPMYDLVRDSVTFDLNFLHSGTYPSGKSPTSLIKSCITDPDSNKWGSIYAANKDIWDSSFQSIIAIYNK